MHERRDDWRWAVALPCLYDGAGRSHEGCIIDISLGGAYIQASHLPPKETRLQLVVLLDDGEPRVTIDCTVVRSGRFRKDWDDGLGFGVVFADFSDQEEKVLKTFLGRVCQFACRSTGGRIAYL